ncbi:MAG: PAS domain S-box protein [Candidatus Thermoplasmatota archaeon]|nr:PAS domain S-box protein [Candidatus Thermoplasmatota archaeon]
MQEILLIKRTLKKKIKETNEKIQKIIDSSPSGICVVDKNGIVETWSPACEKIFGWTAEEVVGRFNPTVPNDKKKTYFETIKKSFTNWEQKALTKDSKLIDISISTVPLNENGKIVGALAVMTDISEHKMIERQIQESERKYRTLFNTMAQGVIYQDRTGFITSANPAAERILGFSLKQMQEMKSDNLRWLAIREDGSDFSGEERPAMIALQTGEISKGVMGVFNPKENEYKWIQVTAIPEFKEGENRPYRTYTSFEDITELKKTQNKLVKSEKDYRILFEEQVNGFAICQSVFSNDGSFVSFKFLEVNPAYEKILNVKREDVIGKKVEEVFPGTEDSWIETFGSVAVTGKPQIFEMFHQPTNKYYYCNVYRPWKTSDRFCIVFNDVTDRKNAERKFQQAHHKLQELNKTLEKKVEQRTQEINQLLKHKDEFIHQLGHDLKNPLGPLINLLPILQRGEDDPRKQEMFMVINRNVGYMKNLVTKTLELARLNSPNTSFIFEMLNLYEQVNGIIETNKLTFKHRNILVKNNIAPNIVVSADSLRLDELFTNIINNAVKYTSEQGEIIVAAIEEDHQMVRVSVSDTGIGMTEKQIRHMFDEFYKADPSRHDFDSSGLGMSICKRIVERHGGRIWAESEGPGKGSTFYFTLPKGEKNV